MKKKELNDRQGKLTLIKERKKKGENDDEKERRQIKIVNE